MLWLTLRDRHHLESAVRLPQPRERGGCPRLNFRHVLPDERAHFRGVARIERLDPHAEQSAGWCVRQGHSSGLSLEDRTPMPPIQQRTADE